VAVVVVMVVVLLMVGMEVLAAGVAVVLLAPVGLVDLAVAVVAQAQMAARVVLFFIGRRGTNYEIRMDRKQ
jgi:hypothetical protein